MSLFYEPNKAKLDRLIEDATLSSGATILIPNLQRAYVWQPDQVILLIDSLIKGWPFGSLLLWSVEPACMPDISVPPMPKRSLWSLVSSVEKGGSAEKAGFKLGDILTRVDGKEINRAGDLSLAVGNAKPGAKIELEIWREGAKQSLTATPGEQRGR